MIILADKCNCSIAWTGLLQTRICHQVFFLVRVIDDGTRIRWYDSDAVYCHNGDEDGEDDRWWWIWYDSAVQCQCTVDITFHKCISLTMWHYFLWFCDCAILIQINSRIERKEIKVGCPKQVLILSRHEGCCKPQHWRLPEFYRVCLVSRMVSHGPKPSIGWHRKLELASVFSFSLTCKFSSIAVSGRWLWSEQKLRGRTLRPLKNWEVGALRPLKNWKVRASDLSVF